MSDSLGLLLVVDDEELNRDMLGRRLELEGYFVLTAADGAEALELLSGQEFDAVLLDAMMPGLSGYDVLAEIRKARSSLELPVLMCTAKTQNEDVVNAFEIGANDYLTKPINFPVALARIKAHVAGRKLSTQLRESEMRYSLSAQGSNDGLWDWNLRTDHIHFSDRWAAILGLAGGEVGDGPQAWFDRVHPDDLPHVRRSLEEHRAGKSSKWECEYRMRHRDETYRWVLTRGMAVRDAAGREVRMAGSQTDITRGKAADPLTGLPNRVLFVDHLSATIEAAAADDRSCFAVLFLDLDRFKVVNDSLGHLAGDELLVVAARRLETCLRRADLTARVCGRTTLSRFGGDEFVILLTGLHSPADAETVAERILAAMAEPLRLRDHDVSLSASIGIAVSVGGCTATAEELLRDADTAMYRAKTDGKNRWRVFDQELRKQAVDRLALEADLKNGLDRGEFHIHYQPIVELPAQRVCGFEALLRWTHPTRGEVTPAVFIPAAEEIGCIVDLGTWVLREACRQVRRWQSESPACGALYVSVNVSTKQFADPRFLETVLECLRATDFDPKLLKLEITESAIVGDPTVAAATIDRLRQLGIGISLDDFGTGYSSLSYLQNFKIDTLKIDRSFVARLGSSYDSDEIVRTIVALAHNLGMEVVAEGIEDDGQHDHLRMLGCESGQGYRYSRPLSPAAVAELLGSWNAARPEVVDDRRDESRRWDDEPLLRDTVEVSA